MSTSAAPRLTLHAVGDIGFGGRLRGLTAPDRGVDPFAAALPALSGAGILFGNLETPLVPAGATPLLPEIREGFAGEPSHAARLRAAGFGIVSLANNHVMDYGVEGLRSTLAALEREGIRAVGAGEDLDRARCAVVVESGGFRAAFLAYAAEGRHTAAQGRPGAAPLRERMILEDVRAARARADAVIVSLHFGLVYTDFPRTVDQALARAICDGGASLVLGHHPHVMQGFERRGDSAIAYSLGEFLFDPASGHVENRSADAVRREAVVLRAEMEGARVVSFVPRPTRRPKESLFPEALEGAEAGEVRGRLERISTPLASEDALSAEVAASTSARNVSHQWDVFLHHLRRGHVGVLGRWLVRLRPRHLALVLHALRSRLRSR